jgi:ABC-type nitrate/sulfonate/bicarbonate transport system substrate-binding protein
MTGQHREEEAAAVEEAWRWYQRNPDASFAEVVQRARALYPSIAPGRVWAFFEVRLRRGCRHARGRDGG